MADHVKPVLVERAVADLVPYAHNSRTHSDEQVAQIAAAIREFGWTNPLLVDGQGTIIAGHGRLQAARKLGLDRVPCIVLDHLTDAQRRALVIADNKLAENAGWDADMLDCEFRDLEEADFDLSLTGFSETELAARGWSSRPASTATCCPSMTISVRASSRWRNPIPSVRKQQDAETPQRWAV